MRPDLDEYEELNSDINEPRGRAMSWLVLAVAVVGFGALAYYAYKSGSQSVADGQMLVVEAETGAVKEAPADPGGEQFPHKDKTIYNALSPYRTDEKVETLLPPAEDPVIPEPAVGATDPKTAEATTSYVNQAATAVSEENEAEDKVAAAVESEVKTAPAPVAKPLAETPVAPKPVEARDALDPNAPRVVATKEEMPAPAPKPAPVPVEEPKPAPAPVAKVEPKPEPKPAPAPTPAASGGNYKIQLGAVGSDAEARQLWNKITAKHGDVVKGSPIVVKADVNGKTFYRVRASGFASADAAKKACATLSGRGQACFPAGK